MLFSCSKNIETINLEAAIDEYLYLEKQSPLNHQKIEQLKSKLEHLNIEGLNIEGQVSRLYYLSEISLMQGKTKESYEFILKAYNMNHADSIYKQKEKINSSMIPENVNIDSTNTNIMWLNDINDKLLLIDFNTIAYNQTSKDNKPNIKINEIMNKGRQEIQSLYKKGEYEAAISKAQMLILIVEELNGDKILNIELAQLYQDLSILYAKNNLIELAKETIQKAIILNPNSENKEIQALLNS